MNRESRFQPSTGQVSHCSCPTLPYPNPPCANRRLPGTKGIHSSREAAGGGYVARRKYHRGPDADQIHAMPPAAFETTMVVSNKTTTIEVVAFSRLSSSNKGMTCCHLDCSCGGPEGTCFHPRPERPFLLLVRLMGVPLALLWRLIATLLPLQRRWESRMVPVPRCRSSLRTGGCRLRLSSTTSGIPIRPAHLVGRRPRRLPLEEGDILRLPLRLCHRFQQLPGSVRVVEARSCAVGLVVLPESVHDGQV